MKDDDESGDEGCCEVRQMFHWRIYVHVQLLNLFSQEVIKFLWNTETNSLKFRGYVHILESLPIALHTATPKSQV